MNKKAAFPLNTQGRLPLDPTGSSPPKKHEGRLHILAPPGFYYPVATEYVLAFSLQIWCIC